MNKRIIDYDYYKDLWENSQLSPGRFLPERWDEKADEWAQRLEADEAYRAKVMERVDATAAFLRQNGQLGPASEVLDIGCGPGLFMVEFSRTAGNVTGLDLSSRMVEHAQSYARRQGAKNTSFLACNFKQAGIDELGWQKKFDLVMTCLTPAITSVIDLHKVMRISRGHCLHVSFVHACDSLEDRIAGELYPDTKDGVRRWDGRVFYSVFNLLFLEGYHPRTFYFKQTSDDRPVLDEKLAGRYAVFLEKDGSEREHETERIYTYLKELSDKENGLHRHTEECYGFLFWDVNEKRPGKSAYGKR